MLAVDCWFTMNRCGFNGTAMQAVHKLYKCCPVWGPFCTRMERQPSCARMCMHMPCVRRAYFCPLCGMGKRAGGCVACNTDAAMSKLRKIQMVDAERHVAK